MLLYVLSDLHAEFAPFVPDQEALQRADVVVLAGDINHGEYTPIWARKVFGDKPIVLVIGNHEFYDRHWERCLQDVSRAAKQVGVHFLENEVTTIGGVDFIGATLWTDFELMGNKSESIAEARQVMADYREIAGCDPLKTIERHLVSRAWLADMLTKEPSRPRVVVTHHYPSPLSTAKQYADDPATAAFGSDLPAEFFSGVDLWVHGHTHTSFNYRTHHGCRVLCNPRGYLLKAGCFENANFNSGLLVSL